MRPEFWVSGSDNLVSQNLACGSICTFFPWHLKVWINECGKSVVVAVAVLILIISYSIRAPGGSATDWEDRQAGMQTHSRVNHQRRERLGDIKRHSLGDRLVAKWQPTSMFRPRSLFHIQNDFPYGKHDAWWCNLPSDANWWQTGPQFDVLGDRHANENNTVYGVYARYTLNFCAMQPQHFCAWFQPGYLVRLHHLSSAVTFDARIC